MEGNEFPVVAKPRALSGEVTEAPRPKFAKLGEWIMRGYSAGLVTVVDSTARVIESEEEGASK
jgi:hypothetical protein